MGLATSSDTLQMCMGCSAQLQRSASTAVSLPPAEAARHMRDMQAGIGACEHAVIAMGVCLCTHAQGNCAIIAQQPFVALFNHG